MEFKQILTIFWVGFVLVGVLFAQDDSKVGVFTEFSGIVERKVEGAEQSDFITTETKDLSVRHNDVISTGPNSFAKIVLVDGTVLTVGPNTTLVMKKTEGKIGIELKLGKVRVDIKSDMVTVTTPSHTIAGSGASVEINVPQKNEMSLFCIEGNPTVTDNNGFQIFPEEGQVVNVKYDEGKKEFLVTADKYNEENLRCKAKETEYNILPGGSVIVDENLNVKTREEIEIEEEGKRVKLPKLEEPKDEPYEDAGDIYQLPVVSPKKP